MVTVMNKVMHTMMMVMKNTVIMVALQRSRTTRVYGHSIHSLSPALASPLSSLPYHLTFPLPTPPLSSPLPFLLSLSLSPLAFATFSPLHSPYPSPSPLNPSSFPSPTFPHSSPFPLPPPLPLSTFRFPLSFITHLLPLLSFLPFPNPHSSPLPHNHSPSPPLPSIPLSSFYFPSLPIFFPSYPLPPSLL